MRFRRLAEYVWRNGGLEPALQLYANRKPDRKVFVVGAAVRIVYVLDEMKEQPARDGGVSYSQSVLEMAVSLGHG